MTKHTPSWKQPKWPWTDAWIKKIRYIYTMDCYSATKRNKTGSLGEQMDLALVGHQGKTSACLWGRLYEKQPLWPSIHTLVRRVLPLGRLMSLPWGGCVPVLALSLPGVVMGSRSLVEINCINCMVISLSPCLSDFFFFFFFFYLRAYL